jgi:NADPH2:quinone reductase
VVGHAQALLDEGLGELLVRTEAVGVTLPSVRRVREGSGPLPGVLGGEVAGRVAALGGHRRRWA